MPNLVNVRGTELLAEDTRERYRQKLARITLDSMVQFVGLLDADGTVLEINQVALDGGGLRLSDVEGMPFWTTFWWQVSADINAELRTAIQRAAQGEFVRWDTEIYGRAGGTETIVIDASLMPVMDEQGKVVFITAEGRDITEKKAQEREIARQREELAKLDELKTKFFANISYEFRTPLTLMLGPLDDAVGDGAEPLGPNQRERIAMVQRNGLRLQKLVNALLDFSRVEAGRIQAVYQPTDLASLTRELASSFRSACEKAGLTLTFDLPPLPEPVFVDHEMWEKIVLNLVSNAFKFTLAGGIGVSLHAEDGQAVLRISDTGTGIPAGEVPRIFDRFHRVEGTGGRTHEGTGIGLALVKELIELHKAQVSVESVLGSGTTFTVRVPFGSAHLPLDRIEVAPALVSTATRADAFVSEALRWIPDGTSFDVPAQEGAEKPRIVMADDNADLRDYLYRLLAPSYDVIAVADGEAALEEAKRRRPDLILSDVMMPRLDGFGLLRSVRADPALRDLPVILLSARAGEQARVESLQAGADDYMIKPFAARELLARVGTNIALGRLRRESMVAAVDSAERLSQMFEQAPGFMCMLRGPDFVFELVNSAFTRLIGGRDVVGRRLRGALPELAGQDLLKGLRIVYRTGQSLTGRNARVLFQFAPGIAPVETFVDFVYQPVRDRDGSVTGIFIEGADVTERMRAETALRETNERLEARVRERTTELEQALGQLRAEVRERERVEEVLRQAHKMEAIGQLTGGVAHDFNNLLTVISGGAETLQRLLPVTGGPHQDRIRRALSMIQQGSERAATLTHRLLAFARQQALDPRPIEANKLVAGMSELLHRTLGESVAIETVIAGSLWRTSTDPNQLENALLNLAVNARDAMPNGGKLTIETANAHLDDAYAAQQPEVTPGQYVMIAVSDTGEGMSLETMERVFEPFFTTKELGQGTGLGLSQVYGFIKQSNGHIKIYSELGHGTVVKLYLPRLYGDAGNDLVQVADAEMPHRGDGELILVVEDDDAVRTYSTDTLREFGYRVITARDGRRGLELLVQHPDIRLLFTDVGLPGGLNGRQFAELARLQRPDLKVLFTTGYAGNAVVHGGILDAGMNLLPKPFTHAALGAKIRSLLGG